MGLSGLQKYNQSLHWEVRRLWPVRNSSNGLMVLGVFLFQPWIKIRQPYQVKSLNCPFDSEDLDSKVDSNYFLPGLSLVAFN